MNISKVHFVNYGIVTEDTVEPSDDLKSNSVPASWKVSADVEKTIGASNMFHNTNS